MIEHKKLRNGFEYIEVENSSAKAKIALQGAHIFEYVKKDEESFLWLSEISDFEHGKSIRGGIPICWPWLGFWSAERAFSTPVSATENAALLSLSWRDNTVSDKLREATDITSATTTPTITKSNRPTCPGNFLFCMSLSKQT